MCLLVVQVRILKRSEGIIASVSLSHLIPTFVYDVEPSVAWHLIASGSGQEVLPSTPALVVAIDEPNALDIDDALYLQYQVSLGAHGAHKF